MKKMEKKTIVIILVIVGAYILSLLAIWTATSGEWVCIANECTEEVRGDEWISHFCRPNADQTDMICDFNINDQDYSLLLSQLDATTFKSCIKTECMVNVYVKQNRR